MRAGHFQTAGDGLDGTKNYKTEPEIDDYAEVHSKGDVLGRHRQVLF